MRENGTGRRYRYASDEYVDTREAARFLGVSVHAMRSMLRRGAVEALDANRIPGPRGWCISVAALRRARRQLGPLPNACPCCDQPVKRPQPTAV